MLERAQPVIFRLSVALLVLVAAWRILSLGLAKINLTSPSNHQIHKRKHIFPPAHSIESAVLSVPSGFDHPPDIFLVRGCLATQHWYLQFF